MTAIPAIPPITTNPLTLAAPSAVSPLAPANTTADPSFSSLLMHGLKDMETKVGKADELVRRFAVDDSVPVHQVTFALEEARLSIELAMQVRTRLVEAYRDLMNMQL
jgi:flagellar hook-basal body complex protein FliE